MSEKGEGRKLTLRGRFVSKDLHGFEIIWDRPNDLLVSATDA